MSPSLNGFTEPQSQYSPLEATRAHFLSLRQSPRLSTGLTDPEFQSHAANVTFTTQNDAIYFPCPLPQTETVSVLKAIEGCWAACLADLRFGKQTNRKIEIHLERSARYLLGTYLFKIDGMAKGDPGLMAKLKDTDLHQAHSIPYRRASSNVYATKNPGEFFHLHGSLEASTALKMVGMEPYRPDLTEYPEIVKAIEGAVKKFTVQELEDINAKHRQAGTTCNTREAFLKTEYGKEINDSPKWSVTSLETSTPPPSFPPTNPSQPSKSILSGLKVLELCRIIAGSSICRILTEYGASVLKITSPNLSDTPLFQVEGNMGKHAADLNLRDPTDRAKFESLLGEADILVDGYRTGALERLGYGPQDLSSLATKRGKGYIYVSENCFGYGQQMARPGWQQVADAVTGLAWAEGKFMGLDEPCIPPFPMSDYGTGLMGAIAALEAVYRRAQHGGSWHAKCALVQYDNLLFQLGPYPQPVQQELKEKFAGPFFQLRHADSTDMFSKAALTTMKEVVIPALFANEHEWAQTWAGGLGYGSMPIRCIRPVSNVDGVEVGYRRGSRPNGTDLPTWEGWEVEEPIA